MTIVSMNFSKILAEKNQQAKGKINIANDVSISKLEKAQLHMGNNTQDCLRIFYKFSSKAQPEIGQILIEGDVVFMAQKEKIDESLDAWKNKKPVDKNILTPVVNHILNKCNIESLILSQTIGLPPPIQLPSVNIKEKEVADALNQEKPADEDKKEE